MGGTACPRRSRRAAHEPARVGAGQAGLVCRCAVPPTDAVSGAVTGAVRASESVGGAGERASAHTRPLARALARALGALPNVEATAAPEVLAAYSTDYGGV